MPTTLTVSGVLARGSMAWPVGIIAVALIVPDLVTPPARAKEGKLKGTRNPGLAVNLDGRAAAAARERRLGRRVARGRNCVHPEPGRHVEVIRQGARQEGLLGPLAPERLLDFANEEGIEWDASVITIILLSFVCLSSHTEVVWPAARPLLTKPLASETMEASTRPEAMRMACCGGVFGLSRVCSRGGGGR